jgi:hypothetical protein
MASLRVDPIGIAALPLGDRARPNPQLSYPARMTPLLKPTMKASPGMAVDQARKKKTIVAVTVAVTVIVTETVIVIGKRVEAVTMIETERESAQDETGQSRQKTASNRTVDPVASRATTTRSTASQ